LTPEELAMLSKGVLYFAGRDYLFRPLVVLEVDRLTRAAEAVSEQAAKTFLYRYFLWVI
jgi:hypothetical protein